MVVFDSFNINQKAVDVPVSGSSQASSTTIAYGNGTRTLTAKNTANNGQPGGATSLEAVGGSLSFSNADKATGKGTLTYTGVGNLVYGADPYFLFDVGTFDNVAQFSVDVTDNSMNTSTYSETLAPGFDPQLFFSQFMGSADFSNVATLSFMIDTTNVPGFGPVYRVDGSLDAISVGASAVPLPAAGLLLLGGLGGLGGLRKLRRRQTA